MAQDIYYISVTFGVDKRASQAFSSHYGVPASRYSTKMYTYKSPVPLNPGDLCVVNTPTNGETVCTVQSCKSPAEAWGYSPSAYKWISGIVDQSMLRTAWEQERIAEEERKAEQARKTEARAAARRLEREIVQRTEAARKRLEEAAILQLDPAIAELQRQLEAAKLAAS